MISIAVTGPESCGKTQLTEALTAVFPHSMGVEEFARGYMTRCGLAGNYTALDVRYMAQQQWESTWHQQRPSVELLISDTEQLVMWVWMKEVFGINDHLIRSRFLSEKFDLYLLCSPDIPWEPDSLRENETDRNRLFSIFEKELQCAGKDYHIISGKGEDRTAQAVQAIQRIMKENR